MRLWAHCPGASEPLAATPMTAATPRPHRVFYVFFQARLEAIHPDALLECLRIVEWDNPRFGSGFQGLDDPIFHDGKGSKTCAIIHVDHWLLNFTQPYGLASSLYSC